MTIYDGEPIFLEEHGGWKKAREKSRTVEAREFIRELNYDVSDFGV